MKDKPISHKNENIFKFQSFSERLANININVIHQVKVTEQTPEDADTFFYETLQKWVDLNCTEDFDKLCKTLGPDVQSLPQVLHKKNTIINILDDHLQNPSNLALNAILELIVALARDLQVDFYPFFPKIFSSVIKLLDTKDTEILENVFTCLSFLFKFLWRYMVKDIENVYNMYLSLLRSDQKEYIRNFAAESFAFLMRKINDKERFFIFMFQQMEKDSQTSDGISRLLFHMMKGVRKEFHSCIKNVFPILMKCLGQGMDLKEELLWDEVHNVLIGTLTLMAKYTEQKKTLVIWQLFFESINKLLKNLNNESQDVISNHLCRLLLLFHVLVCYSDGKLILSVEDISKVLMKLLHSSVSIDCKKHTVKIIITLINYHHTKIPMEVLNEIVNYIYSDSFSQDIIIDFTRNMFNYTLFEKDILPPLLKYFEDKLEVCISDSDDIILTILTEFICNKFPFVTLRTNIDPIVKHTFLINSATEHRIVNLIVKNLSISKDKIIEKLPKVWSALICFPHIKNLDEDSSVGILLSLVDSLCKIIMEENIKSKDSVCFVLCHALTSLIRLPAGSVTCTSFNSKFFINLIKNDPKSINSLLLLDIFLTSLNKYGRISYNKLYELFEVLLPNLMSPYHIVRFLTLRIMKNFSLLGIIEETPIFEMCLAAEIVPTSFQEIRNKLHPLQKLNYEHIHKILNYDHYKQVPIYYLIGILYANFKLLWQPVKELIASFICLKNVFWDIYIPHLTSVYELIEETAVDCLNNLFEIQDYLSKLFHENMLALSSDLENPDHINHRILLWEVIGLFPNEAETKNRHLVTLLFYFICNEFQIGLSFFKNQESFSKVKNIQESIFKNILLNENDDANKRQGKKNTKIIGNKIIRELIQVLLESALDKDFSDAQKTLSTLKAHLIVFSKFQNPKSFYQHEELLKLYNDLLSFRDPEIQKLAFDCLMTFGHKHLKLYSENFYRLLDNKTFKTETIMFNLESENGIIKEEHRIEVLPVLMRILYGKMLCKTGNNTSGKSQSQKRRNLVLRFLAGCKEDEIQIFFDIAFFRFKNLINDDILTMIKNIKQMKNLMDVYPLHIQISALNTLKTVFVHLRNLISTLLPKLYQILIAITTIITTILENKDFADNLNFLKSSRTLCIKRLIEFYRYYDSYPFSSFEIDAIFEIVVWSFLPRLEKEAVNHCSPLLRLFATWCENSRYHSLLIKCHPLDMNLSPLHQVMKLYSSPNVKQVVIQFITNMLVELLSTDLSEMEKIESSFVENNCYTDSKSNNSIDNVSNISGKGNSSNIKQNFGNSASEGQLEDNDDPKKENPSSCTLIVLPYVENILKRIKLSLEITSKNQQNKPCLKELIILSRICDFISNDEQLVELTQILIVLIVIRKKLSQDIISDILEIIYKLIKKVEDPTNFIQLLAPLFSSLTHQKSRILLCSIITVIGESDNFAKEIALIIKKINAWNPKQIEEPDYDVRLEGYKMLIKSICNIDQYNSNHLKIIIHNCIYFIKTSEDLSLRDNASYALQMLAKSLVEKKNSNKELFHVIVKQILIIEIRKGLKHKMEIVRHEFIKILIALLCNNHTYKPLKELSQLCNNDKEMDFWENIKHIQIHRRTRALSHLIKNLKTQEYKFHFVTLSLFIIPIASSFLYDASYIKHNHLIDAAIEVIGTVCQYLPWHRYIKILQYYLGILLNKPDFHKISVKLIVSILNGFHFDLSKCKELHSSTTNQEKSSIIENDNTDDKNMECNIETSEDINEKNIDVLDEGLATKVYFFLSKTLLPKLHSCLSETLKRNEHKFASKAENEDEIIIRLPIAIAMIKLLQNLPDGILQNNISGIFLKLCNLLKSHARSIRETARETLIKIMQTLGPSYLWYLIREMKAMLKLGYQLHVLSYTIHSVLTNMQNVLQVGNLDNSLDMLIQICNEELFGQISEEKEVDKIVRKLKEAGAIKSYAIYQILGKYISDSFLKNLVYPLSEILASSQNYKVLLKIQACFRHISLGLAENTSINVQTLLIFIHGLINEKIFQCSDIKKTSISQDFVEKLDSYIIPKEPPRGMVKANINILTNNHLLVEFGLQLLVSCLKKEKLLPNDQHCLEMLDPFTSLLLSCLQSSYAKVISLALRCLTSVLTFPLPSLQINIENIVIQLFVLLKNYAGIGMAQGENFEIVVTCFKALTVVILNIEYYTFTTDQLTILLGHIEQDINDHTRQGTAFNLLKAIISRKLATSDISTVAKKISELSITAKQEHVRSQCRQIYLQYLENYIFKKKEILKSLSFYIEQLEYHHEYGRISCLELLNSIFNNFSQKLLKYYSGLFFVPLSARLVNDDSSQCRHLAAMAIKNFLTKVDDEDRTKLFTIVIAWLKNKKMLHRRLGAQLCGLFAEVENNHFEQRLLHISDILEDELKPSKYENMTHSITEKNADHILYHLLNCFLKIVSVCPSSHKLISIWNHIQSHLLHPHIWIQLAAAQVFGLLFSQFSTDDIVEAIHNNSSNPNIYLLFDIKNKLKQLCKIFLTQLSNPDLSQSLSEQLLKNLIYLAKIFYKVQLNEDCDDFVYLIKRISREANIEVVKNPKTTIKRTFLFKFIAAIVLNMDKETLENNLTKFLTPLCREVTENSHHADLTLKNLAQEVLDIISNVAGVELFTEVYSKVHSFIIQRRTKRKQETAAEAIINPQKYARKRIKKQQDKKNIKKRKITKLGRNPKKLKLSDITI